MAGQVGPSGIGGASGYSGASGRSGYSGYSGISGYSGYSGLGTSGYSGYSGSAATINATNNVVPRRNNATSFADSVFFDDGAGTTGFINLGGTTSYSFYQTQFVVLGGRINFGTVNSASVPALIASGTTLTARLGDNSADTSFSAASVRGNAVAFAALPATPVEGMIVAVTDSNTATWGATVAGGGANHVLAYYNGTNWRVIGA